jgi:hypothetical protein
LSWRWLFSFLIGLAFHILLLEPLSLAIRYRCLSREF